METFVVRARLGAPVIPGRRLCLDALLAAAVFRETEDLDAAHGNLPLARDGDDRPWAGSAAIVEGPVAVTRVGAVMSLRAGADVEPDAVRPKANGRYPRVDTATGRYQNQMSIMEAWSSRAVWWIGVGDVGEVRRLLGGLPGIGKKAGAGFGVVTRWDVEPLRDAGRHAAWIGQDGMPLRPIPAKLWAELAGNGADQSAPLAEEQWRAPYWKGAAREVCAVPVDAPLVMTEDRIASLVGLA